MKLFYFFLISSICVIPRLKAVYRDGVSYLLRSSEGFTAFQSGISNDFRSPPAASAADAQAPIRLAEPNLIKQN
jgi:hypothetical protein